MANTTFQTGTVVTADWLNDVNDAVYTDLGGVGGLGSTSDATKGDALVGVKHTGTGAVASTQHEVNERTVFLTKFMTAAQIADVRSGATLDISTAWAAAITHVNTQLAAAVSSGFPVATAKLIVPAGDYKIDTGATVANCNLAVEGEGKEVTRIRIGSGQYLLTVSGTIYQFEFRGISTSGGKGVLKHTSTSNNVQGIPVIEDNNFFDYTECAIGSLASDMPYWKVRKNVFMGSTALTSKGVALAGSTDLIDLADNAFLRNKYHIKLGKGANNAKVLCNDLIRFTSGGGSPALVDIWIVPNSSSTNAGEGCVIGFNKFGNENFHTSDYKILLADEAAGTDFVTKDHATTASTGYWIGARLLGNNHSGVASGSNGTVYSYTPNIRGLKADDHYQGTKPPYIVHFDSGVTVSNDRTTESSLVSLSHIADPFETKQAPYSNQPSLGIVDDPFALLAGHDDYRNVYPGALDPGYADLWTTASSGARLLTQSNTTRSNITDSIGGADAAEYTFSTSGGFCYGYMAATTPNRLAWIEIELKKSSTNPLADVQVDVRTDGGQICWRRFIKLPTNWQRIRIPWVPRSNSGVQSVQFRAVDYSAGVADRFQVGKIEVYHAAEPLHFGARYLEASATYDPGSLADGAGATTTVTCTGAVLGDFAIASFSLDLQGITVTAYVSATDTVSVRFQNESGGVLDLASGTLRVRVYKKDS